MGSVHASAGAAILRRGTFSQESPSTIAVNTPSDTRRIINIIGGPGECHLFSPCWGSSEVYATPEMAMQQLLENRLHWQRFTAPAQAHSPSLAPVPCAPRPRSELPRQRCGRQLWRLARDRVAPLVRNFRKGALRMDAAYWLESLCINGQHFYGSDMLAQHQQWSADANAPPSLVQHVEEQFDLSQPRLAGLRRTHYFDASTARRYEVVADAGRLVYGTSASPLPVPVATPWGETLVAVLTTNARLLVIPYSMGSHHHSSLVSGGAIAAAGEIMTDAHGRVKEVTDKSGHYRAGPKAQGRLLQHLQRMDVLSATDPPIVRLNSWLPKSKIVDAWAYLQTLPAA